MKENISLIGVGNPVIDVHIATQTCRLIEKYNLKLDTQNDLPAKSYASIRDELSRDEYSKTYIPGGCVQNTVRIFQWLANGEFNTVMYGTVGTDRHARFLASQLEKENVVVRYSVAADKPTTSAVLLSYKHYRTIVYTSEYVDACFDFSRSDPEYLESLLESLRHAKILLIDGFFTLHCPQYVHKLLDQARRHDVLISFSGGGESVIKANGAKDTYLPFVQRSHVVSFNLNEFRAACHLCGIDDTDLKSALKSFCQLSSDIAETKLCPYSRIIVVTDGENPVHCYTNEDGYLVFPVQPLEASLIKDTTGAGDAFMAGFLYGVCQRKSLRESLRIAYRAAVQVIQLIGCQVPDTPPTFIHQRVKE